MGSHKSCLPCGKKVKYLPRVSSPLQRNGDNFKGNNLGIEILPPFSMGSILKVTNLLPLGSPHF